MCLLTLTAMRWHDCVHSYCQQKAECRFAAWVPEVPCLLTFNGEKELLEKVRKCLEEIESKAHRVGEECSDDVEKDEKRQTNPCSNAITEAEIG